MSSANASPEKPSIRSLVPAVEFRQASYLGSKASFSALLDTREWADFCRMGACWYIAPMAKQTSRAPVPAASAQATLLSLQSLYQASEKKDHNPQ